MKETSAKEHRIVEDDPSFRIQYFLFLIFIGFLQSPCAAQKRGKPYYEDLSQYRPRVANPDSSKKSTDTLTHIAPVTPTRNVNKKVDEVLDSIDQFNLTKKFVDGFTIQIYSGQKREEAMNTKQKMSTEMSGLTSNLQYIQPKFRVTVGSYFTRIEAQKDLAQLKRHFPNAILVPEKILIR